LKLLAVLAPLSLFAQGMGGVKVTPRASPKANVNITPPEIRYADVAETAGLTAANTYGGRDRKDYILEMTGNGVATFDAGNDGLPDILFVNGTTLKSPSQKPAIRFYRNRGGGAFEDLTAASGLSSSGWGQGVCAGDYDNDGYTDIFITYYGRNVLYRNSGGKFVDVTGAAGLPMSGSRWGAGCTFTDYDRDGRLDLFVSNYLVFDLERARKLGGSRYCSWKGVSVFCGPRGFPTGTNVLYHNDGNGRFSDVTAKAGIAVPGVRYGLGAIASDFDRDGWPDIYVACDSTPSLLFHNNRDGTFTESGVAAGVAYGEDGQERGGMGVAAGDYDNDGWTDLLRTNFMDEASTLYRNRGELFFDDATYDSGLGINTRFVSWGGAFIDADHDGWKDIVIANGHIYPELTGGSTGEDFAQPKVLYWNLRNGAFRDLTRAAGAALNHPRVSRGLALADLDGDGSLEIVVNNMNDVPSVYKNAAAAGNAVILELTGSKSNRSAIGAQVRVISGKLEQTGEVHSGGSFYSQSDLRLHFGLGEASRIDRIEIEWPSGLKESVEDAPANHSIRITEGRGVVSKKPFQRGGAS
jgi:hypothetical protein